MERVLIADDHPLYREAIRLVVTEVMDEPVCVEAGNFQETLRAVDDSDCGFDLVLLDLSMPDTDGYSGFLELRKRIPTTPIVVVSYFDDEDLVRQGILYGAAGYIPKATYKDEIGNALRLVLSGGVYVPAGFDRPSPCAPDHGGATPSLADVESLTPRQLAVFELIAAGQSNKQIAYELGISEWTVKAHVTAILRKLKVHSRVQAVVLAQSVERGI